MYLCRLASTIGSSNVIVYLDESFCRENLFENVFVSAKKCHACMCRNLLDSLSLFTFRTLLLFNFANYFRNIKSNSVIDYMDKVMHG